MSADGVSVLAFAAGAACAAAGCAAQQHRRISRLEELAAADRRRRSERDVLELFDSVETASRQRYPRRVILIRHGESEGNTNLSIYKTKPDAALRLTAQGRQQALAKGRALREELGDSKVHFIVSPYTRTRETMHYILQAFSPEQYGSVVEDPRIREQEFGMFQDPEKMPEIMRERRKIGAFYYRFPDGESGADVYDRVDNFVEHLHRTFKRPAERGKNRRPQVVSRTDRHGRTRSMSDVKTEGRTYDGRTPDPSPTVRPPQTLVTGAGKSAGRVCAPIRRAASIDSPELVGESAEGEALHPLRRAQSMDDTAAGATAETVIIVTHGLTARLFLMRWFHLTVDQFHSLWNLRNCGSITMELFKDERDSRARYMLTAPVEAGGQFPPPHTDMFVDGRNSTEPCTWGITLDEAAALWDKHDTAPNGKADEPFAAPSARRLRRTKSDPNLTRGPLPREQALAFLKDVVDIAFPRLVQNGYYLPDTDTSEWPQKIWEMYAYDRSAKEKKTQMEWSLVMTRILPLDVSDGEPDSPKTRPSSSSTGGRSEDLS